LVWPKTTRELKKLRAGFSIKRRHGAENAPYETETTSYTCAGIFDQRANTPMTYGLWLTED
jgi:hypothetical protein